MGPHLNIARLKVTYTFAAGSQTFTRLGYRRGHDTEANGDDDGNPDCDEQEDR